MCEGLVPYRIEPCWEERKRERERGGGEWKKGGREEGGRGEGEVKRKLNYCAQNYMYF